MSAGQSLRALLRNSLLPPNEARILLAHLLDKHYQLPRSALLSRDDMVFHAAALQEWHGLESRRIAGEPIAYILGKKGFHGVDLQVAPGVLIPRPETELLVDLALKEIERHHGQVDILDLGTGSGAIALAVASAAPTALVVATDQSVDALAIAALNTSYLGLQNQVQLKQGDWYEALGEQTLFDVILSNPPYITALDPHLSQGDLRFEPLSALTDHGNGLGCLKIIISQANQYLKPGGWIAVEHGYDQSEAVVALLKLAGLQDIVIHLDLAGHQRVVSGRK